MLSSAIMVELGAARYPIHLGPELPGPTLAVTARAVLPAGAKSLVVVTDHNVAPPYLEGVAEALTDAGYAVSHVTLPAGEAEKHMGSVLAIVDHALGVGLTRHDALVALGGGVVGDITGLAAALIHRGIAFIQVPTTLLAQVDSAVGGKTGVNHARGKNLIGAFWQPKAVVSSQATLRTLPPREIRCGLAEALKHGFIADAPLLSWALSEADALLALAPAETARLVAACCRIKAAVVAQDEREDLGGGPRMILNFGHTFGHAFEAALGYGTLTHGEAVALGMVLAARVSERLGVGPAGLENEVVKVLSRFALPADPDRADPEWPSLHALVAAARGDKKADGGGVRFVLLEAIGRPVVRHLPWDVVSRAAAP